MKGVCEYPTSGSASVRPAAATRAHSFVCFFAGAASGDLIAGVEESTITALLKRIGDSVLLTSLPAVMTGPVETAAAKIEDTVPPQRMILYNPRYLSNLKQADGDYAVMFVLAHELGHHVNADVWLADRAERYRYEFAADAFAARVLARLNATEDQTKAAIAKLPDADTELHPDPRERQTRIVQEYQTVKTTMDRERAERDCRGSRYWNGSQCVERCSSDQQWNGTTCVARCAESQYFSTTSGTCVDRCEADERWDGSSCVARCEDSERWNGSRCVARCSGSQEWDGTRCVNKGLEGGTWTVSCGCWGYIGPGATRRNRRCASGWEMVEFCPAGCPLGGYAWGMRCTEPDE